MSPPEPLRADPSRTTPPLPVALRTARGTRPVLAFTGAGALAGVAAKAADSSGWADVGTEPAV